MFSLDMKNTGLSLNMLPSCSLWYMLVRFNDTAYSKVVALKCTNWRIDDIDPTQLEHFLFQHFSSAWQFSSYSISHHLHFFVKLNNAIFLDIVNSIIRWLLQHMFFFMLSTTDKKKEWDIKKVVHNLGS